MACVLADVPSWIQALVAVSALILAALSLKVLKDYAADTKKIAKASACQTENSQMPFLAVIMRQPHLPDDGGGWGIQNQGSGSAINVRYSGHVRGNPALVKVIEPIAQGATARVHGDMADAFDSHQPVVIEYESLSGARYRSTVAMVNNEMQTHFEKLNEVN